MEVDDSFPDEIRHVKQKPGNQTRSFFHCQFAFGSSLVAAFMGVPATDSPGPQDGSI
jgi:hypothetical protein